MTFAIALDLFVAALLVATIVYAVVLNRRLARLRADRAAFEKLLSDFTAATQRAESGVAMLQKTASASAAELDSKRDGAVALRNDLEFLVARAGEQADRLDDLISRGRDREMPRAAGENIFDRLRETAPAGRPAAPVANVQEPAMHDPDGHDHEAFVAANDLLDDGLDAASSITPGWLQAARRVAGKEAGLR